MKTKQPASSKKQPVALKDLTTRKNPKGGVTVTVTVTGVNDAPSIKGATVSLRSSRAAPGF